MEDVDSIHLAEGEPPNAWEGITGLRGGSIFVTLLSAQLTPLTFFLQLEIKGLKSSYMPSQEEQVHYRV